MNLPLNESRGMEVAMTDELKAILKEITVDEQLPWSGGRLCSFSAKDSRRNRDSAVPDRLFDVSKQ